MTNESNFKYHIDYISLLYDFQNDFKKILCDVVTQCQYKCWTNNKNNNQIKSMVATDNSTLVFSCCFYFNFAIPILVRIVWKSNSEFGYGNMENTECELSVVLKRNYQCDFVCGVVQYFVAIEQFSEAYITILIPSLEALKFNHQTYSICTICIDLTNISEQLTNTFRTKKKFTIRKNKNHSNS